MTYGEIACSHCQNFALTVVSNTFILLFPPAFVGRVNGVKYWLVSSGVPSRRAFQINNNFTHGMRFIDEARLAAASLVLVVNAAGFWVHCSHVFVGARACI